MPVLHRAGAPAGTPRTRAREVPLRLVATTMTGFHATPGLSNAVSFSAHVCDYIANSRSMMRATSAAPAIAVRMLPVSVPNTQPVCYCMHCAPIGGRSPHSRPARPTKRCPIVGTACMRRQADVIPAARCQLCRRALAHHRTCADRPDRKVLILVPRRVNVSKDRSPARAWYAEVVRHLL